MTAARLLILPPHTLWRAWTGQPPDDDEDRELPFRLLAAQGFSYRRLDLNPPPLNPAPRSHTLFRAMDPLRALRVLLLERRCGAVLCFFESAGLIVLLLRGLLRFRGKVVIVDVGGDGWRLRRLVQDRVMPRADAVLPYSAVQAEAVRRRWPGARQVRPVRAHVDCRFFAEAADQPGGPVLAVGDDASRDYATLTEAASGLGHPVAIRTSRPLPGGAGPCGARPGVTVVLPLPLPGYRDLIAGAAVVALPLHPSGNAGGVSALVQAMASGKAVVVSASPGIAEYVTDGVDALVVPCHDPAALGAAVRRLLDDAGLRRRLGAAARARAVREFSLEAWAAQLAAVLGALGVRPDAAEARSGEMQRDEPA